jgi:hypothetical protein
MQLYIAPLRKESKNFREHNGQEKTDKGTNKDLQNTTQ